MFLYVLEKIKIKFEVIDNAAKTTSWEGGGGIWYAGMEMVTTLHAHTELSDKYN